MRETGEKKEGHSGTDKNTEPEEPGEECTEIDKGEFRGERLLDYFKVSERNQAENRRCKKAYEKIPG